MSCDNIEMGRLKMLFYTTDKDTMETFLKSLCEQNGVTEKEDDWTWREMFDEEVSRNDNYEPVYLILGNGVFEVKEYKSFDDPYHTTVKQDENGDYCFTSHYYNGATCLEETLEDELNRQGFFKSLRK